MASPTVQVCAVCVDPAMQEPSNRSAPTPGLSVRLACNARPLFTASARNFGQAVMASWVPPSRLHEALLSLLQAASRAMASTSRRLVI